MKKPIFSFLAFVLFAFGVSLSSASAQSGYGQQDLDAMLAPIALYPDELLTQVLIASTYPEDVADARHYLDRYPSLQQSSALLANQVSAMPWDDSVKSLAQFPSILAMLDDQPEWTDALGYAFLYQQTAVMQTVQRLRLRAQRAGYLRTNSTQIVDVQRNIIVIIPARDNFFYVPYYDPNIVYGRWWWPNRPPYYWDPPLRYRPPNYALVNGFFFGVSVGIINSIFTPVRPDWRRHYLIISGGTKPGTHWQWKPRPQRPGHPNRPNRPPTTKPILKPKPPRPVPPKPGKPQIQPPRPGQPGTPGQSGKPRPEKPATLPAPAKPVPPVTRPAPTPNRPVTRPAPAVTKPTVPVTQPAPATRPAMQAPGRPATRPAPNKPDKDNKPDQDNKRDRRELN
ncbi:MAG TPA: DUF3300 domain-containing protein [Rhizomicrobium sp.]|jgi:hypothetical protein|nr:DUF3300 domain-containing protein [Rhizomicrobium sp.]